jgi:hypothetical protein
VTDEAWKSAESIDDANLLPESVRRAHEELFTELVQAQGDRRRRRRARRAQMSFGLLALVAATLVVAPGAPVGRRPAPIPAPDRDFIEIVQRPERPLEVEYLTEEELLDTLLAEGFDLGLVKHDGETLLVGR